MFFILGFILAWPLVFFIAFLCRLVDWILNVRQCRDLWFENRALIKKRTKLIKELQKENRHVR